MPRARQQIRVVSFDLDGTLADLNFEDAVWFDGIPRLYAAERKTTFKKALAEVGAQYKAVSPLDVRWYDIHFWFRRLGLHGSPLAVMRQARHTIKLYPDTIPALVRLRRRFKLVIISNAAREFIEFKLAADGLGAYFARVFSAPSDLGMVKGNSGVFEEACRRLKVKPGEVVHIGDQKQFDYEAAGKAGVRAYLLDRSGRRRGKSAVRSLGQFADLLLAGR